MSWNGNFATVLTRLDLLEAAKHRRERTADVLSPNGSPADLMTVQEVSIALGTSPETICWLCRGGGLPHVRLGKDVLIRPQELRHWLKHFQLPV
jgi:excisionase family DNA binding protein